MNRVEHLFILMRPRHGEHLGMGAGDILRLCPQTARDDDPAIGLDGLTDGLQAFGLGAVEEAAGVDDHGLRAGVIGRNRIALGAQPRQDAFAVDQRLGTAKRDHPDPGLAGPVGLGDAGAGNVGSEFGRVLGHASH